MPFSSLFKTKDSSLRTPNPSRTLSSRSTSKTPSSSPFNNLFTSSANSKPRAQSRNTFLDTTSDAPPVYTMEAPSTSHAQTYISQPGVFDGDDPFAFLAKFDTVFLIDDSGSMAGRYWRETRDALKAITPICTDRDPDGIDIYFLNTPDRPEFRNIKKPNAVDQIFKQVKPHGGTPTGDRLWDILEPYLNDLKKRGAKAVKPLNIIVVTDGVPTDDPEQTIIDTAQLLDEWKCRSSQVGIQFFQVGNDERATKLLIDMDDNLAGRGKGCRDIVDTVPFSDKNGVGLNGEGIMKVVLGAVNKRLDRQANNGEIRQL